ncbi:MAG: NAD(+)/NADH kinase [Bacillus sp. (in: Bacteria)]|nr:NAD(+)/NADH kinase [Bacillus sp. (in: firmicutes)]MCM1425120.1 NAD(+)/NADH kinase [Eubacterium sp.]
MKHFFLITNEAKDRENRYTGKITAYLKAHGADVAGSVSGEMAEHVKLPAEIDCVIVLGGDGTLLKAARDIVEYEIPLIGINLGTLGYLAEVEISNIEDALDKLIRGEYTKQERMMLTGSVYDKGKETENNFALNDIVISRCGSLQILQFDIYVNGKFLNGYSADGMIVATPTGSTGYNLSAGGPIVEPGARLLLLTPICPHTLNTRSIVLSPEDEVTIEIPAGKENAVQTVEANFDGTHKVTLKTGDKIVIKKASKTAGILKLNTESFLEILHKKMSDA